VDWSERCMGIELWPIRPWNKNIEFKGYINSSTDNIDNCAYNNCKKKVEQSVAGVEQIKRICNTAGERESTFLIWHT